MPDIPGSTEKTAPEKSHHLAVPFRDAVRVWLKISLLSFGGPAGQIAVMHRLLVDELKWVSERRFLDALNFCMLLPCLLYTSPSPRDKRQSRMPSSA